MDKNEIDPSKVEIDELKCKKPGFFKRLRRRVSSVFQRKPNRKRNKSEPCLPDIKPDSQKQDSTSEQRLSLNGDNQEEEKPLSSGDVEDFRPPAKAHVFVNDFTAELKKSLKMRSKMVEEGQASNAIMQIEMSRSNYEASEEEKQEGTDTKTFEEKLALFESQISGGSLQNSLSRDGKLDDDNKGEDAPGEGIEYVGQDEEAKKETEENVGMTVLEISDVPDKGVKEEINDVKQEVVDYELNVCENIEHKKEVNDKDEALAEEEGEKIADEMENPRKENKEDDKEIGEDKEKTGKIVEKISDEEESDKIDENKEEKHEIESQVKNPETKIEECPNTSTEAKELIENVSQEESTNETVEKNDINDTNCHDTPAEVNIELPKENGEIDNFEDNCGQKGATEQFKHDALTTPADDHGQSINGIHEETQVQ